MPTAAPNPLRYEPEQEVRFAVVMYGGVSLAIYINGVAQELLHMARGTAEGRADLSSTQEVYELAGRILSPARHPGGDFANVANFDDLKATVEQRESQQAQQAQQSGDSPKDPVRSRLVVDILSGTSAGGINAVYLAKALANNQGLELLEGMWLDEGDINKLLNDEKSFEGAPRSKKPKTSLLNSQRMYAKLLEALERMDERYPANPDQALADEVDLFTTATDLNGLRSPLHLSDRTVTERVHKQVFHFHAKKSDSADFARQHNPMLAFAARATSSFPTAFEPVTPGETVFAQELTPAALERARAHFADQIQYGSLHPPIEGPRVSFRQRPFADGGYLDNKPFSHALGELRYRDAPRPVDRKLLFIDPFPEEFNLAAAEREEFNFISNSLLAASSLPRYETIRQDIEQLQRRNDGVNELQRLVERVDHGFRHSHLMLAGERILGSRYREMYLEQMMQAGPFDKRADCQVNGVAYAGYHHLRVQGLTDDLALLLTRFFGYDEGADDFRALKLLVEAWRRDNYQTFDSENPGEGLKLPSENSFLLDFDLRFRMRRLDSLRYRLDRRFTEALRSADQSRLAQDLLAVRRGINAALKPLRDLWDNLWGLRTREITARMAGDGSLGVLEDLWKTNIGPDEFRYILEPLEKEVRLARAQETYRRHHEAILMTVERLKWIFYASYKESYRRYSAAMGKKETRNTAQTEARDFFDEFNTYDAMIFPKASNMEVGEGDEVQIYRVSPFDSRLSNTFDDPRGDKKLAGTVLAAFGAFLKREWRQNDILWGRLDGAEQILTALFPSPADESLRRVLVGAATQRILRDSYQPTQAANYVTVLHNSIRKVAPDLPVDQLSGADLARQAEILFQDPQKRAAITRELVAFAQSDSDRVEFFRHFYRRPPGLKVDEASQLLRRATRILGDMTIGLDHDDPTKRRIGGFIASVGSISTNLAEFLIPGSFKSLAVRHLANIALAAAVLLIASGIIFKDFLPQGLTRFGWGAAAAVLALMFGAAQLRRWLYREQGERFGRARMIASHYFARLSRGQAVKLFLAASILSVGFMLWLNYLGGPLVAATGVSVLKLEFCPSAQIINDWRNAGVIDSAIKSIAWDFLFIPCYVVALSLGCVFAAGRFQVRAWAAVAIMIATAQEFAGFFDVLENAGMLTMIYQPEILPGILPKIVAAVSGAKWLIIISGVACLLAGIGAWIRNPILRALRRLKRPAAV